MLNYKLKDKHIVYIGRALNSVDGGSVVSKRNVHMLNKICDEKVIEFYLGNKTIFSKFYNIIFSKPWGYSYKELKRIKEAISSYDVSYIFIDHSLLGLFSGLLKKYKIEIVVFFHNVEVNYYKDKVIVDGFLNQLMVIYAKKNEKAAIKYADKIICLTDIDSNQLNSNYGRKADLVMPITIEDKYKPFSTSEKENDFHLFVGSAFFANIDAINWYILEVLPFINSKLVIIGTGMEVLLDRHSKNSKLEIHGFVEDLGYFYESADFVINPVTLGSGMKTKTIEALMYGKTVIGTKEAFVGIENIESYGAGYVCKDSKNFIRCIESMNFKKFNVNSREYYLRNFSADFGYNMLNSFLNS